MPPHRAILLVFTSTGARRGPPYLFQRPGSLGKREHGSTCQLRRNEVSTEPWLTRQKASAEESFISG